MDNKGYYLSVKEAAKKWNVSERRVRAMCENGKIEGAMKHGNWAWNIPKNSVRPSDGRTLRHIKNLELRTGIQDYSKVNKLRTENKKINLTDVDKSQIINNAFLYDEVYTTQSQILEVFKLKNQSLPLAHQIAALNIRNAFSLVTEPISESVITSVNRRITTSLEKDDSSQFSKKDSYTELEALIKQYNSSWISLHPVARASFLFSELIRLSLFKRCNTETAFVLLNGILAKNRIPPAIFDNGEITEVKAALASVSIRGNSQKLVTLILEACCRK